MEADSGLSPRPLFIYQLVCTCKKKSRRNSIYVLYLRLSYSTYLLGINYVTGRDCKGIYAYEDTIMQSRLYTMQAHGRHGLQFKGKMDEKELKEVLKNLDAESAMKLAKSLDAAGVRGSGLPIEASIRICMTMSCIQYTYI